MWIALALALAAPAPAAQRVAQPSAAPSADAHARKAQTLSLLLNPQADLISVFERAFAAGFDAGMASDPGAATLVKDYPDFRQTLVDGVLAELRPHLAKIVPKYQARFAQFYAQRLSDEDLDTLTAFYRTPTGVKLVLGMSAGLDPKDLVAGALEGRNFTADDVASAQRSTVRRISSAFDATDFAALKALQQTPSYTRLTQILPDFRKLMAEMGNEKDPELDAIMTSSAERITKAYFEREAQKSGS